MSQFEQYKYQGPAALSEIRGHLGDVAKSVHETSRGMLKTFCAEAGNHENDH